MTTECLKVVFSLMYLASAVLPVVGLIRLLKKATAQMVGISEAKRADDQLEKEGHWLAGVKGIDAALRYSAAEASTTPRRIRGDFIWIGVGVVLGAAASTLSMLMLP